VSHAFRTLTTTILLPTVLCVVTNPLAYGQMPKPVSSSSVVLVDTDDSCRLTVDDTDEGVITPDQSKKIKVGSGEHILKCFIENVPALTWRKVVEAKTSGQTVAIISLKALHIQYDQAVAQAAQRKIQAGQQEQAAAARTQQQAQAAADREAKRRQIDAIQLKINDLSEDAEANEEAAQNFDQQAQMGGPGGSMAAMLATQKRQETQRINLQISELQSQIQQITVQ
jgi:multidrug efflux pump subunit AcrA (membrane-fusion protein)